jgi:hypothetical protein
MFFNSFIWKMSDRRCIRMESENQGYWFRRKTMSQSNSAILTALFCLLFCTTEIYALESDVKGGTFKAANCRKLTRAYNPGKETGVACKRTVQKSKTPP